MRGVTGIDRVTGSNPSIASIRLKGAGRVAASGGVSRGVSLDLAWGVCGRDRVIGALCPPFERFDRRQTPREDPRKAPARGWQGVDSREGDRGRLVWPLPHGSIIGGDLWKNDAAAAIQAP